MNKLVIILLAGFSMMSCTNGQEKSSDLRLFTRLSSDETGITAANQLDYSDDFNIYKYRNFYNGGGVALGDINNDGLLDVYFSLNMRPNKLYLNKGGFRFEDISATSGAEGKGAWSTGVSMADVTVMATLIFTSATRAISRETISKMSCP